MEREEKKTTAKLLVVGIEKEFPQDKDHALAEACYTFSEMNLWAEMGDISMGNKDAIRIWAMVERVRRDGWPKELVM